jgi:hypothetical protein
MAGYAYFAISEDKGLVFARRGAGAIDDADVL